MGEKIVDLRDYGRYNQFSTFLQFVTDHKKKYLVKITVLQCT